MKKHSWFLIFLFLMLILIVSYFVLLYFQTEKTLFELSVGIAILWATLLPVLSSLPFNFGYSVCLPSPILGTWLLIMMLIEKHASLSVYLRLSAFLLSFFIVFVFHAFTRRRTMFWKIPWASLSRTSVAIISIVFLGLGIMLINPSVFGLDTASGLFLFSIVILGYVGSSMLYINYSYRLSVLSNRLDVIHLENELSRKWEEIERKYPKHQRDIDLLRYYFDESFRCFLEGDFERSFIWGYKVIREKTVVDPMKYVDDKRTDQPPFGEIRNALMHSRREGLHISTSKIRQIRKNLFNDCLDLLEREITFIGKVSELPSPKAN